jgi:hypothetical protein
MFPVAFTRQDRFAAMGLAAVVVLAGSWRMAPGVCGKLHDDAIYVSTAKALATGQGYRQIHLPEAPLQTKYPILYPALLAGVWNLWPTFPGNLVAMQALGLACAAAAVALGYLYLVRFGYAERRVAAACALVSGVTPLVLYFAVHTMSEMPFALLLVLALWGVETTVAYSAMSWRRQFFWGAVLALPFLCRTIGAAFIVSGLFVLWRHGRPLRWYASGAFLASLPWVLWSLQGHGMWQQSPIDGYYTDYVGSWTSAGTPLVWQVASANAWMIAYGTGLVSLEGLAGPLQLGLGAAGGFMALLLAGFIPWAAMLPDLGRGRALPWMLVSYLMVMLVWPWPPLRFLVPIGLFLVVYMCLGCMAIFKRWQKTAVCRTIGFGSFGAMVMANLVLLAAHGAQVRQTGLAVPRLDGKPIAWSSYERLFSWLSDTSREEDVIAASMDSMISLYTDRRAFRPFVFDPGHLFYGNERSQQGGEELAAVLKRYRPAFLVLSPTPDLTDEDLITRTVADLRARYPGWLEIAYQDADPRFVVYRLRMEREPARLAHR